MDRRLGERVRIVHRPASTGTIAGPAEPSALDGTPRLPVRWDRTGDVTRWNPEFLVPIMQPVDSDPPVVQTPHLRSIAGTTQILEQGMVLIVPPRWERVSGEAAADA